MAEFASPLPEFPARARGIRFPVAAADFAAPLPYSIDRKRIPRRSIADARATGKNSAPQSSLSAEENVRTSALRGSTATYVAREFPLADDLESLAATRQEPGEQVSSRSAS